MTGHEPAGTGPAVAFGKSGFSVTGLSGFPEVGPGTDLAGLIAAAAPTLADGDIVVITSKVVSKAEGRVIQADRDKAIEAETVRVVAQRGPARIVQTRHGLVLAAAGVDNSNLPPGTVALLPEDPDGSARRIRAGLRDRLGVRVGVLITDTMGRPRRPGSLRAGCRTCPARPGSRAPAPSRPRRWPGRSARSATPVPWCR